MLFVGNNKSVGWFTGYTSKTIGYGMLSVNIPGASTLKFNGLAALNLVIDQTKTTENIVKANSGSGYIYIAADGGNILRGVVATDGTIVWTLYDNTLTGTSQNLNSIAMETNAHGWVAGDAGTIIELSLMNTATPVFMNKTAQHTICGTNNLKSVAFTPGSSCGIYGGNKYVVPLAFCGENGQVMTEARCNLDEQIRCQNTNPVANWNDLLLIDGNYGKVYMVGDNGAVFMQNLTQTVSMSTISDKTSSDPDFTVTASSDAGLPITFQGIGPVAWASGNLMHLTGSGGIATVRAIQAGTWRYTPAQSYATFSVSIIGVNNYYGINNTGNNLVICGSLNNVSVYNGTNFIQGTFNGLVSGNQSFKGIAASKNFSYGTIAGTNGIIAYCGNTNTGNTTWDIMSQGVYPNLNGISVTRSQSQGQDAIAVGDNKALVWIAHYSTPIGTGLYPAASLPGAANLKFNGIYANTNIICDATDPAKPFKAVSGTQNIYICADGGNILKGVVDISGNITWTLFDNTITGTSNNLNRIVMIDANAGWVVGTSNTVLEISNMSTNPQFIDRTSKHNTCSTSDIKSISFKGGDWCNIYGGNDYVNPIAMCGTNSYFLTENRCFKDLAPRCQNTKKTANWNDIVITDGNLGKAYMVGDNGAIYMPHKTQTITIDPISQHTTTDADFAVNATSSAGLSIYYVGMGKVVSAGGNMMHLTGTTGIATVRAINDDDWIYLPTFSQITFTVVVGTNIAESSEEEISVFPNPSNGIVYIKHENQANLQVYDISGKQIKNFYSNYKKDELSLKKGIYLLKIKSNSKTLTQKVLVE